jgi:hypothetical protein
MKRLLSSLGIRLRFLSWSTVLFAIVAVTAVVSYATKSGSALLPYSEVSYFLPLLFATSFAIRNGIKLQRQTSEIAADVQSLSHELHSSKLEYLGLPAALKGFCQEFSEQQKAEVDFKTHDLPISLSPDISLCFFRVLQEALHNAAKHSGLRHFEV